MTVLKCKMCGGDMEILEDSSVCECEYCGTRQTVPKADDEKKLKLFARAGRLLRACEFDKAAGVYEAIVADFDQEAEAYWGLILCKYGIEYVDDSASGKKVPTCHRSSFDSVMEDSNFELVMENADAVARPVYRAEAKEIERIRKGVLEISAKEEPYDVFICYKETDENGNRTVDSLIAQDVYTALTEKGYRVFFSRTSLEDKLGQEYEPYIFAALHSARVMLAFGTSYENYNAVWVKNEWSRYLALIAKGEKKTLIPCYKDLDAYDMPKEFQRFQAQDMGKVGSLQDLIRGVEKIIGKKKAEPVQIVQQAVVSGGPNVAALLKRGQQALEDEEWDAAKGFFDQVLSMDAENAQAFLGLAMTAAKTKDRDAYASVYTAAGSPLRNTKDKNTARARKFDKELNAWFDALDAKGKQADKDRRLQIQTRQQRIQDRKPYLAQVRKRNSPALHRIAAGYEHTVGLRLDGTVVATGSNEFGQCNVSGWTDIVAIAAGKHHTVGLRADGTLVATGKNDKGQCNVSREMHVTTIAAGSSYTVCLREDGTVDIAGEYRDVRQWKDIVAIAAGDYDIAGLRADGTVYTTLDSKSYNRYKDWSDIVAIAMGFFRIYGLKADGTVVYDDGGRNEHSHVSRWEDIVDIAANEITVFGLKADGTVVDDSSDDDVKQRWKNIVAIAPGSYHVIGLQTDGTVVADGLNDTGKCSVGDWKLFDGFDSLITASQQRERQREAQRDRLKKIVSTTMKMIAIGGYKTVGLSANGTVAIAGYDSFIQGTKDWQNIIAVAAGEDHVVGLRAGGTVVATGENDRGQCDVSDWTDIVAVAAGDKHTVGLKSNGTVVVNKHTETEKHLEKYDVSGWKNITAVAAGIVHTVGLKADGTVIAVGDNSQGQCDVSTWRNIVAIAAGKWHTVGLKADGTVIATNRKVETRPISIENNIDWWKDIVAIAAGNDGIIAGLRSDGTVLYNIGWWWAHNWRDIVAIAGDRDYTVGIKADGTVVTTEFIKDKKSNMPDLYKRELIKDWKLFNSADTVEEECRATIEKRTARIAALTEEKESLKTELSNLKGLFTGRRRREIETRLAEIDAELKKLG